jgi:signal transduction histidine kinase
VTLAVDIGEPLRVAMPATSLRRCVVALVDNAITHSPRGGTVLVRLTAEGAHVVLTVSDEGHGIVGISPERVFDRFAHSESAKATPSAPVSSANSSSVAATTTMGGGAGGSFRAAPPLRPGFGIGLALVRDIATRQGGSVRVASTSSEGTTFRLDLPAAR